MSTMSTDEAIEKAYTLGMDDAEADHHGTRKGQRSLTEVFEAVGGQRGSMADIRDAYASGWRDFW